jgi:hypothetical protein
MVALSACGTKPVLDLGGEAAEGGVDGDVDAGFVVGGAVPCGYGVCSPPDVCCANYTETVACEPESLCPSVALGCTGMTCPSGSVCCALAIDAGVGWTRCVQGSACRDGAQQVCTLVPFGSPGQGVGCPAGQGCYGTGNCIGVAICLPSPPQACPQ